MNVGYFPRMDSIEPYAESTNLVRCFGIVAYEGEVDSQTVASSLT